MSISDDSLDYLEMFDLDFFDSDKIDFSDLIDDNLCDNTYLSFDHVQETLDSLDIQRARPLFKSSQPVTSGSHQKNEDKYFWLRKFSKIDYSLKKPKKSIRINKEEMIDCTELIRNGLISSPENDSNRHGKLSLNNKTRVVLLVKEGKDFSVAKGIKLLPKPLTQQNCQKSNKTVKNGGGAVNFRPLQRRSDSIAHLARLEKVYSMPAPSRPLNITADSITPEEFEIFADIFYKGDPWTSHYLKIRNHIIQLWNENKPKYVTKLACRPGLKNCGVSVHNISWIHAYLEQKGIINFGCSQCHYLNNNNQL